MKVKEWFRVRPRQGDVGIEIEAEGHNLPHTGEYWNVTHDGSLRGESLEYVLKRPMSLPEARKALDYLSLKYEQNEATVNDSDRCGVHVHVNCQELNIVQLYNFFVLYLVLEDLLVKFCGDSREGNLFCLRAKDAEYLLYTLSSALEDKEFRARFSSDDLRYASMNVKSLPTYGSLEFRAMRGTKDMDLIYKWADLLVGLREKAKTIDSPIDIVMGLSMGGAEAFLTEHLGEHAEYFLGIKDLDILLMEGVRRAQEIAYAGDWEELSIHPKRMIGGLEVASTWDEDWPPIDA